VKYHPDKVTDPALRPSAESLYIALKLARDTLIDPVKRFAYDRLGPSCLEYCSVHCKTQSDYVLAGATRAAPLYIASLLFLVVSQVTGYLGQGGMYWRYVTLGAVAVGEMYAITRPFYPPLLSKLVNPLLAAVGHQPYLPFQAVQFARKIAISVFIAINQLAPLFQHSAGAGGASGPAAEAAAHQQIDRVVALANALDAETKRLLGLEMSPFREDAQLEARAREQVRAWLVRNEIRNEPGVAAAIQRALQRRAEGGGGVDGAG
jgi:hypothetical protein